MANLNIPVREYGSDPKSASMSFPVADAISDLNITALFDAAAGVIIGGTGLTTLVTAVSKDDGGWVAPTDAFAQREIKWLCRYHDATDSSVIRRLEIPCAHADLLGADGKYMNLNDAGAGAAFKAAFDAHVKIGANAVVLDSVQLVGRNL